MKILKDLAVSGQISVGQLLQSSIDTDKFLVTENGVVKFRTGSEILSDIGAPSTSGTGATGTWGISISGNSATTSQTNFSALTINSAAVATQSWVQSQGYLTSVSDVWVNNSGDSMTGNLSFGSSGAGITWSANTDGASITFESTGDGASGGRALSNLLIALSDNGDEGLKVTSSSSELLYVNTNQFQYKGNIIWHSANDGSGSGLDADLLDGINSGSFLRSDVVDATITGTILSTNNANIHGPNFEVNTTNKTANEYAYQVSRSGSAVGGILIDGRGVFASGTTIAGNTALHAGNYNSYSPSLTGVGSSGNWGINVTGWANSLNNRYTTTDANSIWEAGVYTFFNGTNVPGGDFGMISIPTWGSTNSTNKYNLQIGSNISGNPVFRTTDINGAGTWRTIWHTGNLTNLNQLTNGPGYITGYTETDTLATVTGRGNTTTGRINVRGAGNQGGGNILMGNTGNGSNKWSYLTGTHYNQDTQTQGVSIIGAYSDISSNVVVIGGSIYEANPATEIQFWTHTSTTHNLGGSKRMIIDTNGNIGVNINSPLYRVDISGSLRLTGALVLDDTTSNVIQHRAGTDVNTLVTVGHGGFDHNGYLRIGGANVATQSWVQSQGYLTSVSDVWVNTTGDTMTGPLRFNEGGFGRIAYADNYHGMILRGIPNDALGNVTIGDYTSLIQHSGDFRFYRTNGSINELYFQVNATASYWRGNVILHASNYNSYSPTLTGGGASGTWGVNITGSAGSLSNMNISQFNNNSGYITSTNTDFTYNASLTISTSWQDTGVSNSNLTSSGVYVVTVLANDAAVAGYQYSVTHVGLMYWYAASTNGVNFAEIPLHHMGHADNDRYFYLRTRTTSGGGGSFLQIRGNYATNGNSTYTFTFKRLL